MKTINGKKMKELLEKKHAKAIDVDSEVDFKQSHIKGAVNIPHSEQNFLQKVEKNCSEKNEEIVLCTKSQLGSNLSRLANQLEGAGYQNIYQYKANPSDWKTSGLSILR